MGKRLCEMTAEDLIVPGAHSYPDTGIRYYRAGKGAVSCVPEALRTIGGKKPFIVMDCNTLEAGGRKVIAVLDAAGIPHTDFVFPFKGHIEPDELAMGSLAMSFDPSCDVIIGVGSGVINDCCKVLAYDVGIPSMIVGTAPSMDGYASSSAAMVRNRVKVSLYVGCPQAIIGDTDILRTAPDRMLAAGVGDILAKYTALCEWRMAAIVHGDPYDEEIAEMVRCCLRRVTSLADGLYDRSDETLQAVFEGLVLSGFAMSFAGNSRPASGLDHYFSHMWEMRALDEGKASDLHGIQVAVGTQLTCWIYQDLLTMDKVDTALADRHMQAFDPAAYEAMVRRVFGGSADEILRLEKKFGKNDPAHHADRLRKITDNWMEIRRAVKEELPPRGELIALMRRLRMPVTPADLGLSREQTVDALIGSREIRDKYIASSLLWDLGLLDKAAEMIPWNM